MKATRNNNSDLDSFIRIEKGLNNSRNEAINALVDEDFEVKDGFKGKGGDTKRSSSYRDEQIKQLQVERRQRE